MDGTGGLFSSMFCNSTYRADMVDKCRKYILQLKHPVMSTTPTAAETDVRSWTIVDDTGSECSTHSPTARDTPMSSFGTVFATSSEAITTGVPNVISPTPEAITINPTPALTRNRIIKYYDVRDNNTHRVAVSTLDDVHACLKLQSQDYILSYFDADEDEIVLKTDADLDVAFQTLPTSSSALNITIRTRKVISDVDACVSVPAVSTSDAAPAIVTPDMTGHWKAKWVTDIDAPTAVSVASPTEPTIVTVPAVGSPDVTTVIPPVTSTVAVDNSVGDKSPPIPPVEQPLISMSLSSFKALAIKMLRAFVNAFVPVSSGTTAGALMASSFYDIIRLLPATEWKSVTADGYCIPHLAGILGSVEILQLCQTLCPSELWVTRKGNTFMKFAAQFGHVNVVQWGLSVDPSQLTATNDAKDTMLHWASTFGHVSLVDLFLSLKPTLIDLQTKIGDTPLMSAAWKGHTQVVERLIQAKASLEVTDCEGRTALFWAVKEGHLECVRRLIQVGANVNVQTKSGATALFEIAVNGCMETQQAIAKELLDAGASPSLANNAGNTPVTMAIKYDQTPLLKLLVQPRTCVSKRDLEFAQYKPDMLAILREARESKTT